VYKKHALAACATCAGDQVAGGGTSASASGDGWMGAPCHGSSDERRWLSSNEPFRRRTV
jgi:hypothetical protein